MKLRNNLLYLVILLLIASLFLVACERPLPGGYNDPEAGSDTTVPEVPESVPGVDSEGYPAEEEPAASEDAAPEDTDAADAAEAYPAEEDAVEQEFAAEGEAAAPEGEEAAGAELPAEETPADEVAAEETAETPGTHTVAEGENLYRIGLLYGISWLDLAEANGIVDPANLSVGQELTIPSADDTAEEAVETEEVPADEAADADEAAAVEETTEEAAIAEETTAEAEAAEETTEEAAAAEETTEEAETAEAEEAPAEEAAAAEEAEAAEGGEGDGTRVYVVQAGDNLFRIGVNHGVDWTEIATLNDIVGAEIHPGMELIIPAAADSDADADAAGDADTGGEAEPAGEETTYVVQEGDSIYSVAFEHGIPWTALVEANDIEAPYTLEVGQTLIIIVPAAGE